MTEIVRATEAEVFAVPTPEWTKTWHPVGHKELIIAMEDAIGEIGMDIVDRDYTLTGEGRRLFAMFTLDLTVNGSRYTIGFRNSTDKSMKIGIAVGTNVIVCANMMISGTDIFFRKHTGGLTLESLSEDAREACNGAIIEMEKVGQWQQGLRERYVPREDFKALTFDLMKTGAFAPSQFNNYLRCYDEERKLHAIDHKFPSLHTIHGAATRLMRKESLYQINKRSSALIEVIRDYEEVHPLKEAA